MKYLLLVVLSFSTMANWKPKERVSDCSHKKMAISKKYCEGNCIKVPDDWNCESYKITKKLVDDLTKPVHSKSEVINCNEICQETFDAGISCTDLEESPILNLETKEIYCSKFLRYEQKESDIDIIVIDEEKKALYDAKMVKKKNKELKIKKGKSRRAKCESFLSYVSGVFEGSDEATVDALSLQFEDILSAAKSCKLKKLRRLLNELGDANYLELKAESLEILEK